MFWHYDCANIQIFNLTSSLIPHFFSFSTSYYISNVPF